MSEAQAAAPAVPATPAAAPAAPAPAAPAAPAAPTPAAPAAPTAPSSGGTSDEGAAPSAPDWATRRVQYAKGDEKLEKRLARYGSESDVIDALLAAQNKIASGALKSALPKDATPEQLSEWRADNGIPDTPAGYAYEPPAGVDKDSVDPEAIKDIVQRAHDNNMTSGQLKAALDWHFAQSEREEAALREADAVARKANGDILRQEWGSEYRLNVNLITGMLDAAPQGLKDQLLGARLADGSVLGDSPEAMRWLASTARELNPTATVVPGSGGNAMQAIEAELADMTKLMGDPKSAYWKGPTSGKMQERYRELVTVQGKIKK